MRILVTAASRHGSTADIAERIAATLTIAGYDVHRTTPDRVETLDGYDGAVIGSGVYAGQWLAPATTFVDRYASQLERIPVWLFSSGPIGDPAKPEGEPAGALPIAERLRARDHRVFPGRLDKQGLGFAERAITRIIRAPEGDYRPWPEIEAWARGIATAMEARRQLTTV
jgi:menaquinone-dependent protoporphyrinogen oxidase